MAGNGCYSESYDDIDPAIRDLCRALNNTGNVQTRYSCQGHSWIPFLTAGHPPYLCFDASPEVAKAVHAALAAGRHYHATRLLWVVEAAWMVPEDASWADQIQPNTLLLRWSIRAPVLDKREALWGVRRRIDHDFSWMERALPAAIRGEPMHEWLDLPAPLTLRYVFSAARLWAARKISLGTLRHALRERPIAVAGRGGSFQIDPDFEPNDCTR